MDLAALPWLPRPPADFRSRLRELDLRAPDALPGLQELASTALSPAQARAVATALGASGATSIAPPGFTPVRVAVLGSATLDFMPSELTVAGLRRNLVATAEVAPYDQVVQVALNASTGFLAAGFDFCLLAVDNRWLGLQLPVPDLEDAERLVAQACAKLQMVSQAIAEAGGPRLILSTIPQPPLPVLGSYDCGMPGSMASLVARINAYIVDLARVTKGYVFDVAGLANEIGTQRWFDEAQWNLYKLPFAHEFNAIYAERLANLVGAIKGKSRKCLVLDLDNTLWAGVIGDDGLEGIKIGQGSAEGEAHLALQRYASMVRQHGIVLAVCSKNDEENALLPFRHHPDMGLRESDIAVFQANWTDKASNLRAIADALNLGLDSLVFVDDNPAERAHVRAALPGVAVPELGSEPSDYVRLLASARYFESVVFSSEDRARAQSYADEQQRITVMKASGSVAEYLTSLGMVIGFAPFDHLGIARVAQLINKSNQFNLTTRRYTEAEVSQLAQDPAVFTLQVRLRDSFGDSGMIAVVIARPLDEDGVQLWSLDTWLMSCRVLGRRVEEAMLREIVRRAEAVGVRGLIGHYIPTPKNGMVAEHYDRLGFERVTSVAGSDKIYRLDLERYRAANLPFTVERTG
ncbi:MAG: HAD-IIIC family phosphatase [Gammaproteobacteria bacterium]|nr:HAD-IIIC family phosphatase [Gammaproteobacteria bacterium]